jgi:hypothetical protein
MYKQNQLKQFQTKSLEYNAKANNIQTAIHEAKEDSYFRCSDMLELYLSSCKNAQLLI